MRPSMDSKSYISSDNTVAGKGKKVKNYPPRLDLSFPASSLKRPCSPGVGMRSSGACELRSVWRVHKQLPCALMSSATPARVDHATDIQPHLLGPGLCLSLHWTLPFLLCSFALSACACPLKLRSLGNHTPPSVSLRGILIPIEPN